MRLLQYTVIQAILRLNPQETRVADLAMRACPRSVDQTEQTFQKPEHLRWFVCIGTLSLMWVGRRYFCLETM